jgi:acylphosphatase
MLAWCGHGPSSARVDRIEVEWEGISERMNDFTIRYWGG